MADEPIYTLKYKALTSEEIAAKRADRTWHLMHSFMDGYAWTRGYRGDRNYDVVYWRNLPDRLTPDEFIKLKAWRQDAIVADIKAREAERDLAWRRAVASGEVVLPTFDKITMPVIRSEMPKLVCDDIIGVQPMMGPRKR